MGCQLRGCGFESRPGRRVGFTISSPPAPRMLGLRGEVANASHPWLPYVLLFTDAFELVFFIVFLQWPYRLPLNFYKGSWFLLCLGVRVQIPARAEFGLRFLPHLMPLGQLSYGEYTDHTLSVAR